MNEEDHKSNNPSLTAWLPASQSGVGAGNEEQGGGSAQNSRADTLLTLPLDQCETMLEEFEDVVGDWYFHHQEQPLQHFPVKVMCFQLLKLVSVGAGLFLARLQPLCPPGLISKLFSITQPSMSTGNLDWKGEDHK